MSKFESRVLETKEEMLAMFRLRYDVYCEELKWIGQDHARIEEYCDDKNWTSIDRLKLEIDQYDTENTIYVGVFFGEELVGCERLIKRPGVFMVDPNQQYDNIGEGLNLSQGNEIAELSRLAIRSDVRNYISPNHSWSKLGYTTLLIYKGMYQYSLSRGIRFLVIGTSVLIMTNARRRVCPIKRISEFKVMEDQSKIEVGLLDWREFERYNSQKRSEMLAFFKEGLTLQKAS